MNGIEVEFRLTASSDQGGIVNRILVVREVGAHFGFRLYIEGIGPHSHAIGIAHVFAGLHAQENLVSFPVLLFQVMGIIGGYQWNAELLAETAEFAIHLLLFRHAVRLYFKEEIPLAKNRLIEQGLLACELTVTEQ